MMKKITLSALALTLLSSAALASDGGADNFHAQRQEMQTLTANQAQASSSQQNNISAQQSQNG